MYVVVKYLVLAVLQVRVKLVFQTVSSVFTRAQVQWEPQFGDDYATVDEWKAATHRIGAKLHPLTIEQNAITSFKSRTTMVPCRANTIGPGLFLQADYAIGGADGMLGRGQGWQGMSFLTTLHYGPDKSIASSFIPTLPGRLFYLSELAGPLCPDVN